MMMQLDAFLPLVLATARRKPRRGGSPLPQAPSDLELEMMAMPMLNALKRNVPPPSPEKMAAGKRRLLELAAERRRERLIDLAG